MSDLERLSEGFNEQLDDYFLKVQDLHLSLQNTPYSQHLDYQFAKLQEIKANSLKYENDLTHVQIIQQDISHRILVDLHRRID